jgi:hypothetical protein
MKGTRRFIDTYFPNPETLHNVTSQNPFPVQSALVKEYAPDLKN